MAAHCFAKYKKFREDFRETDPSGRALLTIAHPFLSTYIRMGFAIHPRQFIATSEFYRKLADYREKNVDLEGNGRKECLRIARLIIDQSFNGGKLEKAQPREEIMALLHKAIGKHIDWNGVDVEEFEDKSYMISSFAGPLLSLMVHAIEATPDKSSAKVWHDDGMLNVRMTSWGARGQKIGPDEKTMEILSLAAEIAGGHARMTHDEVGNIIHHLSVPMHRASIFKRNSA